MGLDKLEATLDTYGADRTRWPAPLRLALSGLIAGNAEAQKTAEGCRGLRSSSRSSAAIRCGASRQAQGADRRGRRATAATCLDRPALAAAAPRICAAITGLAATALAASLVLGVFAGQTSVLNTTADTILLGDGVELLQAARSRWRRPTMPTACWMRTCCDSRSRSAGRRDALPFSLSRLYRLAGDQPACSSAGLPRLRYGIIVRDARDGGPGLLDFVKELPAERQDAGPDQKSPRRASR